MTSFETQTAVVGVSGYAGAELARLLTHHPRLHGCPPVFFGREEDDSVENSASAGVALTELHPQLADNNGSASLRVEPFRWAALRERGISVVFLATPHEQSRAWAPDLLAHGVRVIDLSGAWRMQQQENRAVYRFEDVDASVATRIQQQAVYGMPELHREAIKNAQIVANPGCYATSIILGLAPLVRAGLVDVEHGVICDAKSGVSGAGKAPSAKTHFMYAADNLSAYSVFGHRHTGEMLEQLELKPQQITFTPHLLPIPRGIFSTLYITLRGKKSSQEIADCYRSFYSGSPMVRFHGERLPQIQHSVRTNYCDIGFALAEDGKRLIVVSCLDNLLKGAAGQAVQNMNLLLGWPEQEGLL
ncbi:MAG TPA: N-acetyl-gamma-glutamyl-phosphate reductase [Acidobacteriaceae bacterium]|jgi:N-acetyl-gamma-glutamyl-phosphate reductase|nr:N-acetyl-gamma-glutamyl-phosphate reductase [Acidobacteriaceae bacterium]